MNIAFACWYWGATAQRPHQLARQALLAGHRVTVLTSAYWRWRGGKSALHELPAVRECLPASAAIALARMCRPPALRRPLEAASRWCYEGYLHRALGAGALAPFDLVIYTGVPAVPLRATHRQSVVLYDCLDRWESFASLPPATIAIERQLAKEADILCAVTPDLAGHLTNLAPGKACFVSPNGCDTDFFGQAGTTRPASQSAVIGYVGGIHEWFDWHTIIHLAASLPSARFVLVGPWSNRPAGLPANVRLTGPVPYESLPAALGQMDVCLIPFRNTGSGDLLSGVSPVKLYEYLAAGRPVVSCRLADAARHAEPGVIHVADSSQAFKEQVSACLEVAWEPALIERRRQVAQAHSWARRWQGIEEHVRPLLGARTGGNGRTDLRLGS